MINLISVILNDGTTHRFESKEDDATTNINLLLTEFNKIWLTKKNGDDYIIPLKSINFIKIVKIDESKTFGSSCVPFDGCDIVIGKKDYTVNKK